MKLLKSFDTFGQLAITIFLILIYNGGLNGDGFFIWLFALGGWQVVSCAVHAFGLPKAQRNNSRKGYEIALLIVLCVGWTVFPLMLVLGPAMAAWYWATCLSETIQLYNRRVHASLR